MAPSFADVTRHGGKAAVQRKRLLALGSPALVHLELLGQPVESQLRGVLPRVIEVLAVVPEASLDPPVADHNDAGPCRPSTWLSVR